MNCQQKSPGRKAGAFLFCRFLRPYGPLRSPLSASERGLGGEVIPAALRRRTPLSVAESRVPTKWVAGRVYVSLVIL